MKKVIIEESNTAKAFRQSRQMNFILIWKYQKWRQKVQKGRNSTPLGTKKIDKLPNHYLYYLSGEVYLLYETQKLIENHEILLIIVKEIGNIEQILAAVMQEVSPDINTESSKEYLKIWQTILTIFDNAQRLIFTWQLFGAILAIVTAIIVSLTSSPTPIRNQPQLPPVKESRL